MKCSKLLKGALDLLNETSVPLGYHNTDKDFELSDFKFTDNNKDTMFGPGAYFHISTKSGRPANLAGLVPKEFKNATDYLKAVSDFSGINRMPTKAEKANYNKYLVSQGFNSILSHTRGHKIISNIIDTKFFKDKEWLDKSISKLDDYQGGRLDTNLAKVPKTQVDNLYRAQLPLSIKNDITKLKPGQTIKITSNLSTTKTKSALKDFISYKVEQMENIFSPDEVQRLTKNSSIVKIKGPGKGIDVNKLYKALGEKSMYEGEHEVILPKGIRLQYIRKKNIGGLTVHELKLLSSVLGVPVATLYLGTPINKQEAKTK